MRPRFKILDKVFKNKVKDTTTLKDALRAKALNYIPVSGKRYEFKDVWEENVKISIPNWDEPRVTQGIIHFETTSKNITLGIEDDTAVPTDLHFSNTIYKIHRHNYWWDEDTTYGATW